MTFHKKLIDGFNLFGLNEFLSVCIRHSKSSNINNFVTTVNNYCQAYLGGAKLLADCKYDKSNQITFDYFSTSAISITF